MLDINFIRENLEKVKKSVEARKAEVNIEKLLQLDDKRRGYISTIEQLNQEKNQAARVKDVKYGKTINNQIDEIKDQFKEIQKQYDSLILQMPNILMDEVPVGDASKNKIIRKQGKPPQFSFKLKDHLELGKNLNIIDFERGVKVAGFRGYFLKNEGALLAFAAIDYALDHLLEKGYQLIIPPVINRSFALEGAGQFPWGEEDTYKLGDDKYLVGTAEVPLMALHAGEIFDVKDLPKKYVAISPCFRTEIGSYGKDTKGLYRVHEFLKVEQVILCEADEQESLGFFEELQDNSEEILQELGLPYQVVIMSSQEMGKKQALQYDIETWMPSREGYCETHSNSIILDFQTRRLKIRYKDKDGSVKFCHALNNTALASPRILIPLLENFQQEDGSVKIPEVLHKYTGFSEIKPK